MSVIHNPIYGTKPRIKIIETWQKVDNVTELSKTISCSFM